MHKKAFLKCILSFCFILSFAIPLASQSESSETWYYNKEIRKIDFKGLKTISKLELDGIVSPYIGKKFSDDLYAEVLNAVYGLEYFDSIIPRALSADPEKKTVALEFTVEERPIVTSLKFQGNKKVRSAEIRDKISIKVTDIYKASSVLLAERTIRNLYLEKGFTNVTVESKMTKVEDGVSVVFAVTEGKKSIVTKILFQGNSSLTERVLKKDLALKEKSLFNSGAFQESFLTKDRATVLNAYYNTGYIDAKISDVLRDSIYNEKENRDELTITFIIREGSQYTYGGMELSGNEIYTTEELLALVKLSSGDVFNQQLFQQGQAAIANLYYENGYTSNGFNPQMSKNAQALTVSCVFIINERPQSTISNIIVKGNKKTKDYVILREIPLKEGDIFSKTKFETGLRSLYNLRYFSAIVPEFVPGKEENSLDVILSVEEQGTTQIEFGVSFSGVTDPKAMPVSAMAKWSDSNVAGTGQSISTSLNISTDKQSVDLNYGNRWLFGNTLDFSANLKFSHKTASTLQYLYLPGSVDKTNYYMNYEKISFGAGAGVGKRWVFDVASITLAGGISTDISKNFFDANLFEPLDKTVSHAQKAVGVKDSVWTKVSFDARDLNYDPSKGWFFSQQLSWFGFIPQIENEFYAQTDTKAEYYFTLLDIPVSSTWNLKFVLAAYSGLSLQFPVPNKPIGHESKLYVDGMFYGRGWNLHNDRGEALWNNYLELRMPIAPGIFSVDFFADASCIKSNPQSFFTAMSIEDWYFSFGPGIRFSLPQFPLRLLLTNTFKVKNGNVVWQDSLTGPDKGMPQWKFVLSFCITNK